MITISLDLKLIDQSRCKKMKRKNGEAACFADLILIETPDGEYGDYMVKQDVTKEEREAGMKMPIIGNARILGRKPQGLPAGRVAQRPSTPNDGAGVPF